MATKKNTKKTSETMTIEPRRGCCIAVGEKVVIRTVTHCLVGKVVEVDVMPFTHCVLKQASWVGDSGRWSEFLYKGITQEMEVEVEPDEVTVALDAIVDARFWRHKLFTETV